MPAPVKNKAYTLKRNCNYCGKFYYARPDKIRKGIGIYCSHKCSADIRKGTGKGLTKIECICGTCGKIFKITPSAKKRGGNFCSQRCKWDSFKKTKIICTCKICKKSFEVLLVRVNKYGEGKFCSQKCASLSMQKPKVEKICNNCGKKFKIHMSQDKLGEGVFCSLKCKYNLKEGEICQNLGNQLKGRFINGYRRWRLNVFKKDNFTCQKCNDSKGGNLNAHHIESYNNNPTLRTVVDNGITFCEDCHKDFHHLFGFGNNTKKQLFEFLNMIEENVISA